MIKSGTRCHRKTWGSAHAKVNPWCPPQGSSLESANIINKRDGREKETLVAVAVRSSGRRSPAGTVSPPKPHLSITCQCTGLCKRGAQAVNPTRGFLVDVGGPLSFSPSLSLPDFELVNSVLPLRSRVLCCWGSRLSHRRQS